MENGFVLARGITFISYYSTIIYGGQIFYSNSKTNFLSPVVPAFPVSRAVLLPEGAGGEVVLEASSSAVLVAGSLLELFVALIVLG